MDRTNTPIAQLQQRADEIKEELKRAQTPRHLAPKVDTNLLITLSGCNMRLHKQTDRSLVLVACDRVNELDEKAINRALSYIAATYESVTIDGWDFRPVRHKKRKLYLKPTSKTRT
jgi:hypothetical protein